MPEEKEVHMTVEQRKESWKREEEIARIHGWDFSHIHGRYMEEDDLPWDFGKIIQKYRNDSMKLMDMETGGGEFLLTFRHPYENTAAIEGYPPNVELCKKVLLPLGIEFKAAGGGDKLPFSDQSFDIVTNRHGDYDAAELQRVPKMIGNWLSFCFLSSQKYHIQSNIWRLKKRNFSNMVLRYWKAEKSDGRFVSLMSERLFGLQELSNGSFRAFPLKAALNICLRHRKALKETDCLRGVFTDFILLPRRSSC